MLFGATCYGLWRSEPVRAYFRRGENDGIRAAADLTAFAVPKRASRNEVEDEIITWELLDQVTSLSPAQATGAGNA